MLVILYLVFVLSWVCHVLRLSVKGMLQLCKKQTYNHSNIKYIYIETLFNEFGNIIPKKLHLLKWFLFTTMYSKNIPCRSSPLCCRSSCRPSCRRLCPSDDKGRRCPSSRLSLCYDSIRVTDRLPSSQR